MNLKFKPWRDRRGLLSPLRTAALALLLLPVGKALLDAGHIIHGAVAAE